MSSIPVGLARTQPSYAGIAPPFGPGKTFPELASLLGGSRNEPDNHVYAAVRGSLLALGLDARRFDSPDWNPLGALVPRGGSVVLKPNFIRHWNPCEAGSLDSVITHGSILRAIADYALLAVGSGGTVCLAEAPQHDCDWDQVVAATGLAEIRSFYADTVGADLALIDLRREAVSYRDQVIAERFSLPGDPAGYRLVDLGRHSAFEGSGLDPARFRGADYDPAPTAAHHTGGRNEYLLSETVLRADLVVNLPKIKTHKKTGVTLALKNLVGINGDKNLLPHHCVGSESSGGDEYPGGALVDRLRSAASEVARALLKRGLATRAVRAVRRAEDRARGDSFARSGNWHGNRTTWRMCVDLNRCLYYSDREGPRFEADAPVRRVLSVADGIVAGEGEGPLAPRDRGLGVVLASVDPVALDLVAIALMGFDPDRIPKVREAMADEGLRITAVRSPSDVDVREVRPGEFQPRTVSLDTLVAGHSFAAHSGWSGHVECERAGSATPDGPREAGR